MTRTTLRKPMWTGDVSSRDVGEAMRDISTRQRETPSIVRREGLFTYAPPFYLRSATNPTSVTVVRAREDKRPGLVSTGMVAWSYSPDRGGVQIESIAGLTAGGRYLLTFELVY